MDPEADSPDLVDRLQSMPVGAIDRLPFGVIGFDREEVVTIYNEYESGVSGLDPSRVLGLNLFAEVAPCTNNFLVAERFREHEHLDEELDYVFTLRMKPTPVRLRLLAQPDSPNRFMIVVPDQAN